ncbi:MAG: ribosomal subunit interface protein [Flavobacteriaceae bacterium]|nr:ribosomal subunit interface protein [Flavobacteriaceae bacterium]OUX40071.1 MAG: ribosomal subunit interface protein [Flavobacteriaceae bacterium TMED265]
MNVNIQTRNFNPKEDLIDFSHKRLEKLLKFHDGIVKVELILKIENSSEKTNKFAEIDVRIPGEQIVVKKQCKSFEEAIDNASNAVERLLIKHKDKAKSMV